MSAESTVVWVMTFLGCLVGVAMTICVYAFFRRSVYRRVPCLDHSSHENLLNLAVISMSTAYRCIAKGDLEAAKSTLSGFVSNWAGMASTQQMDSPLRSAALDALRMDSAEFPALQRQIEGSIKGWHNKTLEQQMEEIKEELGALMVQGDSNENWQAVMLSLVDGTMSHLAPSTSVKVRMRPALFKGEVLCAQDA